MNGMDAAVVAGARALQARNHPNQSTPCSCCINEAKLVIEAAAPHIAAAALEEASVWLDEYGSDDPGEWLRHRAVTIRAQATP